MNLSLPRERLAYAAYFASSPYHNLIAASLTVLTSRRCSTLWIIGLCSTNSTHGR